MRFLETYNHIQSYRLLTGILKNKMHYFSYLKAMLILLILLFALNSCNQKKPNEHMVLATLWYQSSAEKTAIYLQSFHWAKKMIDDSLRKNYPKRRAVVLDIDETVLDNSPFFSKQILTGKNYSREFWGDWVRQEKAEALPGAIDFINYSLKKGIDVFFISNRLKDNLDYTFRNLQKVGIKNIPKSHILLKETSSDKTSRRALVEKDHSIVLLLGDNLGDFSEIFQNRGKDLGTKVTLEHQKDFGIKFIVLPNPAYGEWEKAIYKNNFKRSNEEKDRLRKEALEINY